MATVQSVLKDYQTLSPSDRKSVLLALNALAAEEAPKKEKAHVVHQHDASFYDALQQLLIRTQGVTSTPFKAFKASAYYRDFKVAFDNLDRWLSKNCNDQSISRLQREGFYDLYATLMRENLEQCSIPVTLRSLIISYNNFPAVFERSFPGYIQSGLFRTVIERLGTHAI